MKPLPHPGRALPATSANPPINYPRPPAAIFSGVNAFSHCTKAAIYAAGWSSSAGPTFTDGCSCSSCSPWSDLYLYPPSPPLVRRHPPLPPPLPLPSSSPLPPLPDSTSLLAADTLCADRLGRTTRVHLSTAP